MNRNDQRDDMPELDAENQLSELMQAHLDEVEGGGAHNSWKRVLSPVASDLAGAE